MWFKQKFWLKEIVGSKKIMGKKNTSEKNLGPLNNFAHLKRCLPKRIGSENNFGFKKFWFWKKYFCFQ